MSEVMFYFEVGIHKGRNGPEKIGTWSDVIQYSDTT